MDRRHWILLIVALACIAALGAWIVAVSYTHLTLPTILLV